MTRARVGRFARWLGERVARIRRTPDRGASIVEFVLLAVVIFVPLVYGVAAFSAVQRGVFAATEAAREVGRILATSSGQDTAQAQAQYAAELVAADQGIDPESVAIGLGPAGDDCSTGGVGYSPEFGPGERFTVCVTIVVEVPFLEFIDSNTATGRFLVERDRYVP